MDFLGFGNFSKCVFQADILTRLSACLFIYVSEDLPPMCSLFVWLSLSPSYILSFFSPGVILITGAIMFDSSSDSPLKWREQREGLAHLTSNFNNV